MGELAGLVGFEREIKRGKGRKKMVEGVSVSQVARVEGVIGGRFCMELVYDHCLHRDNTGRKLLEN